MINQEVIGYLIPYIVVILFLLGFCLYIGMRMAGLSKNNGEYSKENVALIKQYHKELHFRKSSEVRLGKIGENLAPFVKCWPWDPNNFRFLGNPVDGIQFNDDEIVFVEIKTGGARLSKPQKNFRDLVKSGKVSFATFKITEDGTKLIKE
jgi:predicted Holliday junction resolvase-like endonuclease